ncbi:PEP-CTERM sorting domain-containing protein [Nostoc sp. CENA67]|uniref:PEP-CTERM sorting domain-containing protein n=1 Tax=Amazonocrinis nigriterrae CENA67 TaxID=2794033 RepID=A0A8J7L669_9NOST|nr:PEP-CTERM sorting domain-containing protein [Amazonocrinis nigriterrae]MBH8561979.1 PEP-CTERM sorting domain-containing protein [Amazonocrinis nigriterrae CENA67]
MKNFLTVAVVAPIAALGIGTVAQAAVLTFDDIAPIPDLAEIPDGYGGFNWDNFFYKNGSDITALDTGYDNGRVSGDYVSYNGFGNQAILSDRVFDFNSAYLTAAWNDGLSVTVEGLNKGTTLYSKTVVVDTTNPTLVNFDFFGVDELRFTSFGGVEPDYLIGKGLGTQFALDNFTFNETVTPVPEPTLLSALLAVSTLSAGSVLKRKQQQKTLGKA